MHYKGVSKSRRQGMWVARTRLNGRVKTIGEFHTPEEASEAYIKFKTTVERELTQNDLLRLARYKAYVNFCEEPKSLPEFFAEFNTSGSSAVRDLVNHLVRNNFIKQYTMKVAGKVNENKEVFFYNKLKDFNDEDLVPRAKAKALTDSYVVKQKDNVDIIPGARVINFDENKNLSDKYKQQREIDRKSSASKKTDISGASLSSVFW
jgi:hypothetical protein